MSNFIGFQLGTSTTSLVESGPANSVGLLEFNEQIYLDGILSNPDQLPPSTEISLLEMPVTASSNVVCLVLDTMLSIKASFYKLTSSLFYT